MCCWNDSTALLEQTLATASSAQTEFRQRQRSITWTDWRHFQAPEKSGSFPASSHSFLLILYVLLSDNCFSIITYCAIYTSSNICCHQTKGFFAECGALDGEYLSNTIDLERKFNWTGLLIEANPHVFEKLLSRNRKAWTLPICLSLEPFPTKVYFLKSYQIKYYI